jgi:hypothetical protein
MADRCWKVRPALRELEAACQRYVKPGKAIVIDEMMIKCKGKPLLLWFAASVPSCGVVQEGSRSGFESPTNPFGMELKYMRYVMHSPGTCTAFQRARNQCELLHSCLVFKYETGLSWALRSKIGSLKTRPGQKSVR